MGNNRARIGGRCYTSTQPTTTMMPIFWVVMDLTSQEHLQALVQAVHSHICVGARNPVVCCPDCTQAQRPALPACVQCFWAEAHVPLRPLDYIYFPSTYVLGLAKDWLILCESFAHPLGYLLLGDRASSEKIPQADSRPLHEKNIKTSSRRRSCYLYRP